MEQEETRFRNLVRCFEDVLMEAVKEAEPVTFTLSTASQEFFFFQVLSGEVLVSGPAISDVEDEWTVDLHSAPLEVLRALMNRRADILSMAKVEVEKAVHQKMKQAIERKVFIEETDALERWLNTQVGRPLL